MSRLRAYGLAAAFLVLFSGNAIAPPAMMVHARAFAISSLNSRSASCEFSRTLGRRSRESSHRVCVGCAASRYRSAHHWRQDDGSHQCVASSSS
jgi:hypothetical protein